MSAFAGAEPGAALAARAAERHRERAQQMAAPRELDMLAGQGGLTEEDIRRLKERNKGVAVPPVEVGQQEDCRQLPQQPHPQGRVTITVAPDQQQRDTIIPVSKDDKPPYPSQGTGANNSIPPGALVFVTNRLLAKSFQMHQHDRRMVVASSPSGLPLSELQSIIPVGFLSRGQQYNAFKTDAGTESPELAVDLAGVFALINRSGQRIPPNTPLTAALPRRIVPNAEEQKNYLEGRPGVTPVPAVKNTENISNMFELDLVPVPTDLFRRMNEVLMTGEMVPIRLGFRKGSFAAGRVTVDPLSYDPIGCLHILRSLVYADLDVARSATILNSEGVDAIICYRLLSATAAILRRDGMRNVDGVDGKYEPLALGKNIEELCGLTASRHISLIQFVHGKKGDAGSTLDGAIVLLEAASRGWEQYRKRREAAGAGAAAGAAAAAPGMDFTDDMRHAAAGVDAGLSIFNIAANQITQQLMGGVFCMSITPSLPGGELEVRIP